MEGVDGELLSPYEPDRPFPFSQKTRERMFIREIQSEQGSKEKTKFKRFAILPNLEGQKFTIGSTFTCREEQGEFIFLSEGTPGFGSGEAPGCQITVENNQFWVAPTPTSSRGRPAVLINEVTVLEKTVLKFGDRFSFEDTNYKFLFKERELDPAAFFKGEDEVEEEELRSKKQDKSKWEEEEAVAVHDELIEFTPGQNWLTISRILAHLPVPDVKNARLLSKMWNEEALKVLLKRSTVSFDFDRGYSATNESMKLFRYSVEMGHFPIPSWRITIPEKHSANDGSLRYTVDLDPSPGKPGAKFLEDINWFLFGQTTKIQREAVKRLEIDGFMGSRSSYELRLKIMQALGSQLDELTWSGNWRLYKAWGWKYLFPDTIVFNKLQVFTLSLTPVEEDVYSPLEQPRNCSGLGWLAQLIKAIQGVTTIRLQCEAPLSAAFLNLLAEQGTLVSFCNLREMSIQHLNPDVIQALLDLRLTKPLKKLQLFELKELSTEDFFTFGQILSKFAPFLESLLFIIPPAPTSDTEICINFPVFPKLDTLNVGWGPENHRKTQDIKLSFVDKTGIIKYGRDLPNLKSLTLYPLGFCKYPQIETYSTASAFEDRVWKCCGPLYEMFFPAIVDGSKVQMEICRTVRHLEVLHHVPTYDGKSPLFPRTSEVLIAEMFPNVRNEWINSIRDPSLNKIEIQKIIKTPAKKPEPKTGRPGSTSKKQQRGGFW